MTNTFTVAGNVGKDPELKQSQSGKSFAKFSVASKTGKDKTSWFNVTAFGKTAEFVAEYVKKGALVYVSGHIEIEKNEDKYYTNVLADKVQFLGAKKAEDDRPKSEPQNSDMDSEIPF